jgi:hypothetical protein
MFPFQRIEIPNIRDGHDGFRFKWAARILGLGKLTTIIVQSGLFGNFMCSTIIILIVSLIYCQKYHCLNCHESAAQLTVVPCPHKLSKWRLKLSRSRMGGGPWIEKYLPWHQNFPKDCWNFPTKTRGAVFPLIPGILTHQHSRKFLLLSMMYKSTL